MVPFSMTLSDLWPGFQGNDILKSNMRKTARLTDKVTIAQEETIPDTWNGTMFGDLDWAIHASRGFVSISWASCYNTLQVILDRMLKSHLEIFSTGVWLMVACFTLPGARYQRNTGTLPHSYHHWLKGKWAMTVW